MEFDTNKHSLRSWRERTAIEREQTLRNETWFVEPMKNVTSGTATMKFTSKFSNRAPYKEVGSNVVNCISGSKASRFPALHFNAASRPILRFYLLLSSAMFAPKWQGISTESRPFWLLRVTRRLNIQNLALLGLINIRCDHCCTMLRQYMSIQNRVKIEYLDDDRNRNCIDNFKNERRVFRVNFFNNYELITTLLKYVDQVAILRSRIDHSNCNESTVQYGECNFL